MSKTQHKHHVFIGIGSNLNQPIEQAKQAIEALNQHSNIDVIMHSSWYRNPPLGPQDQPDYVNGVAQITTSLEPLELLDALQQIENDTGRDRSTQRWGARTLDLDILLFDDLNINTPRLTIPHSQMRKRNFVLIPLREIAPELILADDLSISHWIDDEMEKGLEKISDSR